MRAVVVSLLGLVLSVGLLASGTRAQEGAPAEAPKEAAAISDEARGDAAMAQRKLKGYQEAVVAYEAALKADANNPKLKLKLATALNAVMRVKTSANLLTLDGPSDTAKNKRLWRDLGGRSEQLAKEALRAMPDDLDANLQYAEAYMYKSSSFGIIKAIMSGSADQYQENANRLIKLDKKADGGVGYSYLGGFFTVAPWPISDDEEAAKNFELALKMDNKSIRNRYYRGLRAVMDEEWAIAKEHLQYAVDKPCRLASEKDFCGALKREAKRALAEANKH